MSNKWNSKAQTNLPRLPMGRGGMFICSKLGQNSFRDGNQDICKDTESNFHAEQHTKNNYELIMQSVVFFLLVSFLACRGHFFI